MNLERDFSFLDPFILPFWNLWDLRKSLKLTPGILITIRKIRKVKDVLQVRSRRHESWGVFFFLIPIYHTFLESLGLKEVTYVDSRYIDHHQEYQEAQGHPPSRIKETWILMGIFLFQTHVSYLFGILWTYEMFRLDTNSNIGFGSSLGHIQKLGIAGRHASWKRP